jgi:hypothetical protein
MGAPYTIVDIPNREIQRVVFDVTCSDRNRCLVATENNRTQERALSRVIFIVYLSLSIGISQSGSEKDGAGNIHYASRPSCQT